MAIESHIFQSVGGALEVITATFVSSKVAAFITAIKPTLTLIMGLFLTLYGYMVIVGKIQEPFYDFLVKATKIIIVASFALNAPNYLTWIVTTINGLQDGLASALGLSDGSIYLQLDTALSQGFGLAGDAFTKADEASWKDFSSILQWNVIAGIVMISTIVMVLVGGVTIIMAGILLKILLAVGPLFIAFLLWPVTAKFFDSWFSQVFTYILKIALVSVVLTLAITIFGDIINGVDFNNADQNAFFMVGEILIASFILYQVLLEVSSLASSLSGGIAMHSLSLGQLMNRAASPWKAVSDTARQTRNLVDPMTTRRDMQSGMMTTARRSNHLLAGNTIANPAYRQHVMQNLTRNWGRRRGGKITE